MRIDHLHLENFRNFKDYKIKFGSKTTVLIGKNGSGKSNLIQSLVYAVSFPFAKGKVDGQQSIATSSKDLKVASIDSANKADARFDQEMNDYVYPLSIQTKACFEDIEINWELRKTTKGGGLKTTLYKDAFETFHRHYFKGGKTLPVLAFFADSYPHIKLDVRTYSGNNIKKAGKLPQNFGYYMWDRESNCITLWKERYIKNFTSLYQDPQVLRLLASLQTLRNRLAALKGTDGLRQLTEKEIEQVEETLNDIASSNNERIEAKELEFVNQRIIKFAGPLREDLEFINEEFSIVGIEVSGTTRLGQSIEFQFKDGRKIHFDHLPQGYKRLLSIVFDISYRSFILNEDREPEGIVFVDELELHLHPTLQQEVLNRFKMTFPNIQFIYSTHSPLIISNFKAEDQEEKLIQLFHKGQEFGYEELPNVYGIDYNVSLEKVMGTKLRPVAIDNLMDTYVILKIRKKEEAAQKIWDELFELVGAGNAQIEKELNAKLNANI